MFGIEILLLDGTKDWIDPVIEEPTEVDEVLTVEGNSGTYTYSLQEISTWFKYPLCNTCEYDLRSYDCTESECNR